MIRAQEMLEMVQSLKEEVLLNGFEKTDNVNKFFDENWMQVLDILDDALYEHERGLNNECLCR